MWKAPKGYYYNIAIKDYEYIVYIYDSNNKEVFRTSLYDDFDVDGYCKCLKDFGFVEKY